MLRWIVGSSLKLRFLVLVVAAALLFFGVYRLTHMPVDVFPEFAPTRVEVQTGCLGLNAADVESLVTVPLEQAFTGVPGLDTMRSKSIAQLSSIELYFKPGVDNLQARQLVQERIATVQRLIPTWATPPVMYPAVSTTGRVMQIGLTSKTVPLTDLSMIAYWTMRARLLRVPGVSNVALWGERLKMLQVQVEPKRLVAAHVSLDQVMTVTSDALAAGILRFTNGGGVIGKGGFVDTANQRLQIEHTLPYKGPGDLAQVPIVEHNGTIIRLGDVAHVTWGHQPLAGDAVIQGQNGVMLVVEKYPWANTLTLTRGVEQALNELKPGLQGIQVDPHIFQAADFIHVAVSSLERALLLGTLLVLMVLIIFLWDWRAAVISLIAIPLSLLTAAMVLDRLGATINTMVLAGMVIAVGVVVDDAIIDIENVLRRLRLARQQGSDKTTARIILEASIEVRSSIFYATLIDCVTLLPIFFVSGLTGALFRPLALSFALAVLASMAVALTVTPALALILLRKAPVERHESPVTLWLQRAYSTVLASVVRAPLRIALVGAFIVLAGLAVVPHLGESLLPKFQERDFLIHVISKPGTSLPEQRRIIKEMGAQLRAIPGVRSFGTHIGQAFLGEEVNGVNFGENWVVVDTHADYTETIAAIERVVNRYPGVYHDLLTYFNERVDEVLAGSSEPVVVRVYGPDLATLRAKADEVNKMLGEVPGITEEHVDFVEDVPQVQVTVRLAAAERYGVKPGDVRRAAATWMAGEEVGDVFRGGKAYDVQVWSTPGTRNSVNAVRSLLIDAPGGGHVRLADVADVVLKPTPNVIEREQDSRRIDVGANIAGRDLGSVAKDVQAGLQKIHFPLGYHAELLGESAERRSAQERLVFIGLAAACGVFLLLRTAFRSWRLAGLAFLALPMALAGGVLTLYVGQGYISIGSLVGFFTVLGIASRNGIMMINHFQHLEHVEGMPFGPELVIRGARERLRPILMTALATGLAIVPLVLGGLAPGEEIEHPMAVVIIGGLITATLLNLFVLPTLYLRFGKHLGPARGTAASTEQSVVQQ